MKISEKNLVQLIKEGLRREAPKKTRLKRIIKEELVVLAERQRPGHRDPESGNWQYPGDPGYDPRRDDSLHPAKSDYGLGEEEYSRALRAHPEGGPVDPNWEHPLEHLLEIRSERHPQGQKVATAKGGMKPYEQGYEAGTRGDRSEMPLEKYGTPFYDAWMSGWDDGLAQFHGGGSY